MRIAIDKFTYDPQTKILSTNGSAIGRFPVSSVADEITVVGKKKNVMFIYLSYSPSTDLFVFTPHSSWNNDPVVRNIVLHIHNS